MTESKRLDCMCFIAGMSDSEMVEHMHGLHAELDAVRKERDAARDLRSGTLLTLQQTCADLTAKLQATERALDAMLDCPNHHTWDCDCAKKFEPLIERDNPKPDNSKVDIRA